jgi:hypothetical protein
MNAEQLTVAQRAALAGLGPREMVLGTTPTANHNSLYASYPLHRGRGWEVVSDMIVANIRSSLSADLAARQRLGE